MFHKMPSCLILVGLLSSIPLVAEPATEPVIEQLVPDLSQEPVLNAIPQEWLSGGTLTVSSLNFAITAPSGWQWGQRDLPDRQGKKVTGFFAVGPDSQVFGVSVWERTTGELQQADVEQFARGMAHSLAAGWTLLDVEVLRADYPVAGTSGVRTRLRAPDGKKYYLHGYIVPGRLTYQIFALGPDEKEPPAFSSFARSLKFLGSTGNQALAQAAIEAGGPYTDALSRCLARSTTSADKTLLIQWMFATIALHPDVKRVATVSERDRQEINKKTAELVEALFTHACASEARQALTYEGDGAIGASFNALGQIAGRELFANPSVAKGLGDFGKVLDMEQLKKRLAQSK